MNILYLEHVKYLLLAKWLKLVLKLSEILCELWDLYNSNHFIFSISKTVNRPLIVDLQIEKGILDTEIKYQFSKPVPIE